jgi:hypothetical protein
MWRKLLLLAAVLSWGLTAAGAKAPTHKPLDVRMDYDGALALLDVLQQRSVTDADLNRLLAVPGVAAMVDNTTKYEPSHTRRLFRDTVKEFVTTRKSTIGPVFRLQQIADHDQQIRGLISRLRTNRNLAAQISNPVRPYIQNLPTPQVTIYSVVGGASDGFVIDNDPRPAFYMALNRAAGDVSGVKLNMAHELVHVVQRAARARVPGLNRRVFDAASAPPDTRLMTLVLEEGSATYIAEPMLSGPSGPYLDNWREAYVKNAPVDRIKANFADFDKTFGGLASGTATWDQASKAMFTGTGSPLYFVGYEMTKALAPRMRPVSFSRFWAEHPASFFQAYVDLYRKCLTCVRARFSPQTERLIAEASKRRR